MVLMFGGGGCTVTLCTLYMPCILSNTTIPPGGVLHFDDPSSRVHQLAVASPLFRLFSLYKCRHSKLNQQYRSDAVPGGLIDLLRQGYVHAKGCCPNEQCL
ncbi:hypothetical protein B0J11DRAFT_526664 [Dendryphion nanum]|uniref:Uncharacterized protein n=1 Tax=Dendryphion nanum TaxID=256645 RepID=A0A9P9INK0_9PLEO|nr:hypothetical protein B0J11DRAFT_526664 [Dendryphion nanum]